MRPIWLRTVWSLNLALVGRRPDFSRPLSMKFAVTELKGDWKWHHDSFELRQYWHKSLICHRCMASRVLSQGQVFVNDVLPEQPCPLILLEGFHVRWLFPGCTIGTCKGLFARAFWSSPRLPELRRWCTMHTNNLGIFQVETAEALLFLAETECRQNPDLTMNQALQVSYNAFRRWCTANKIRCSVRPWKLTHFHLGKEPATPTQHPWVNFKAFNARVVLGWAADACLKI